MMHMSDSARGNLTNSGILHKADQHIFSVNGDGSVGWAELYAQTFAYADYGYLNLGAPSNLYDPAAVESEAIDLLAEKLVTPLQVVEHLTRSLEAGHAANEKPVTAAIVSTVLSGVIEDLEATITRLGYDHNGVTWRIIWQVFWRIVWQKMANYLAIPIFATSNSVSISQ